MAQSPPPLISPLLYAVKPAHADPAECCDQPSHWALHTKWESPRVLAGGGQSKPVKKWSKEASSLFALRLVSIFPNKSSIGGFCAGSIHYLHSILRRIHSYAHPNVETD